LRQNTSGGAFHPLVGRHEFPLYWNETQRIRFVAQLLRHLDGASQRFWSVCRNVSALHYWHPHSRGKTQVIVTIYNDDDTTANVARVEDHFLAHVRHIHGDDVRVPYFRKWRSAIVERSQTGAHQLNCLVARL
jgi:hypothetical protein